MDYSRPEIADRLAAEYAAGTLRGPARRRFESLLPAHPLLREATRAWEERLMPLTVAIEPVQPSGEVWRRISERIGGGEAKPASAGAWNRLAFWRGLAAFASVAAIGLAVLLANPGAVPPPIVVVLAPTGTAPGATPPPSLVASISGDGSTLVTRPIVPVAIQPDRAELWAVPREARRARSASCPAAAARWPCAPGCWPVPTRSRSRSSPRRLAHRQPTGPIVYAGKFSL
jgi:anti-sigma-K factor RskA